MCYQFLINMFLDQLLGQPLEPKIWNFTLIQNFDLSSSPLQSNYLTSRPDFTHLFETMVNSQKITCVTNC